MWEICYRLPLEDEIMRNFSLSSFGLSKLLLKHIFFLYLGESVTSIKGSL